MRRKKQAAPKVTFVFYKPLTKVPSASADSRARLRGEPEYKRNVRRKKQAAPKGTFVFYKPLTKISPALERILF